MRGDLFADDGDERMRVDRVGDRLREPLAIDGERGAGRHAIASAARMTSEPSRRISSFSRPTALSSLSPRKRVGADQLGEPIGLVHGGRTHRPHLVQDDAHAARRRLPGGFATGEPAADDVNHWLRLWTRLRRMLRAQAQSLSDLTPLRPYVGRRPAAAVAFTARGRARPRRGVGAASRRAASSSVRLLVGQRLRDRASSESTRWSCRR